MSTRIEIMIRLWETRYMIERMMELEARGAAVNEGQFAAPHFLASQEEGGDGQTFCRQG